MNQKFSLCGSIAMLTLLSVSGLAHAADEVWQAPHSEPSNPAFMLSPGQIETDSTYEYEYQGGDSYNTAGAKTRSYDISVDRIVERLTYGLVTQVVVYAQGSYVPYDEVHSSLANGTRSTTSSSGFDDPLFGVLYRALTQDRYFANLDLGVGYAPNVISARLPSSIYDGSVALGGQEVDMTVALSRIWDKWTVKGTLEATHFGARSAENQTSLLTENIQPFWEYDAAFLAYRRLSQTLSVLGGVDFFIPENLKITTPTGALESQKLGNFENVTAGINFDWTSRTSLRFQDQLYTYAQNTYRFATLPGSDSDTRHEWQNVFSLILTVVF